MQPAGYSRIQITLHWVIFLLVAGQFVFHDAIVAAWRGWRQTGTATLTPLAVGHLAGGTLVLILVLWRLQVRRTRGVPGHPEGGSPIQHTIANITHWALYALLVLVPLTGLVAWVGGVGASAGAHELLKNILFFVVLLHFVGAIYNQFFLKNHLFARMMKARD